MYSFALIVCTVVASGGSGPQAAKPPEDPARSGVRLEVEGAVLTHAPRDIPKAKRSPRGEMEWIQKARAVLEVKKPIGFRRGVLPAGEYRLRVEVEDGASHYLVIEPATLDEEEGGGEEEGGKEKTGKAKARRKGGGDASFALEKKEETEDEDEEETEDEDEEEEEEEEPAEADPPTKGSAGRAGGQKRRAGNGTGPAPENGAPEAAGLRVPLSIAPCEKTSDKLTFGLKLAQKGSRLRITIRAGTTEARVSLRFGAD